MTPILKKRTEDADSLMTSDLVTGMLLLAVKEKIITKVEACWSVVSFTIGAKLRISVYKHQGNPFLGPDGGILSIGNRLFGGSSSAFFIVSKYTFEYLDTTPNYQQWLAVTPFRGMEANDPDFSHNNQIPPKRNVNGMPIVQA